ncbi:hypothetical protein FRB99_003159 [Tulasnella sp. 403]|nr:hypothetical protein FRB99_003159 [Tulasnella sp. 403]
MPANFFTTLAGLATRFYLFLVKSVIFIGFVIQLHTRDLLYVVLALIWPSRPKGKVIAKDRAGWGGNWPHYIPPASSDSRSPCPGLNTLANHGILPRDGKAVTYQQLIDGIQHAYNLSPTLAEQLTASARLLDQGRGHIDLHDLNALNVIQHDASFSRPDIAFYSDQGVPHANLVQHFLDASTDGKKLTLADMAYFSGLRRAECKASNGQYSLTYSFVHKFFGSGNAALMYAIFGGIVEDLRIFLSEERIPDGWEPKNRHHFGFPILFAQIDSLNVEFNINEKQALRTGDAFLDQSKDAIGRVLQALLNVKGPRNRSIADPFLQLPDKDHWADYYRIIPHPRCLDGIKENVENSLYKTPSNAYDDFVLVFANALHFNEDDSVIAKDARTLKALLETTWASEPSLDLNPPRPTTPPNAKLTLPVTTPLPQGMEDLDMSPLGGGTGGGGPAQETNWESMKPRDKQGDEIVRKTESMLPRWKGPGSEGWMVLQDMDAKDPFTKYSEVLRKLKTQKDKGSETLLSEALTRIAEAAHLPELSFNGPMSFTHIENRVASRDYNSSREFDLDLCRLFEKGRRWFEEGSKDYGRILVLQRMYHGLTSTSSNAGKALTRTAIHNFSSVPAGPGYAKPLHSATSTSEDAVTTYRIQNKDRTFIDEITFKGMSFRSGDYVHLMNPNDPARPIVAQIFKLYVPDNAPPTDRYVTVCWYFRPEQTYHSPQRSFWEHEVFKTGHFADHAIEDVIEKVGCQFMTRHIRGRPKPPMWYPNWPLYVCDSRYNDRDRVFVRIKNWNSCIPDELRKADFMPIQPYERTVMPRRVDSPFLKGVKGPGALVEEDEGRRKSKRAAAAATATRPLAGGLDAAGPDGHTPMPALPILPLVPLDGKLQTDRSLTVAAGGRSALGADPVIEELPEETIRHFDRDPRTNELLWFSGPPIQRINPDAFRPQYSLEYLAFLAKKRAAAEKERADEEMEMDQVEEDDGDAEARRKKLKSGAGEGKFVPRPTLRDALLAGLGGSD